MLNPSEEQIQAAVAETLRWSSRPGIWWAHVPNGGQRHAIVAAKLKGQGVRAGAPDMLLCIGGRFHALELKRAKGGRLSPSQIAHRDEIVSAGGVWAVAHGLDEALATLKTWGAI